MSDNEAARKLLPVLRELFTPSGMGEFGGRLMEFTLNARPTTPPATRPAAFADEVITKLIARGCNPYWVGFAICAHAKRL